MKCLKYVLALMVCFSSNLYASEKKSDDFGNNQDIENADDSDYDYDTKKKQAFLFIHPDTKRNVAKKALSLSCFGVSAFSLCKSNLYEAEFRRVHHEMRVLKVKYCETKFEHADKHCVDIVCLEKMCFEGSGSNYQDYLDCHGDQSCWDSTDNPFKSCMDGTCEEYTARCAAYPANSHFDQLYFSEQGGATYINKSVAFMFLSGFAMVGGLVALAF